MVACKTWRTVITAVYFEQVTTLIVVVDTSEKTTCCPSVADIVWLLVACSHCSIRIVHWVKTRDSVLQIVYLVVFFLITSHQNDVMILCKGQWVVTIKADILIVDVIVWTLILAIRTCIQLSSHSLWSGYTIGCIDVWGNVQSLVWGRDKLIGVIGIDNQSLYWINLEA